jgi:hypothetical protein
MDCFNHEFHIPVPVQAEDQQTNYGGFVGTTFAVPDEAGKNANGAEHRIYSDAMTAQLGERVTNLGRRQSDLEVEIRLQAD